MKLTLNEYLMGRQVSYSLPEATRLNAEELLHRVNELIEVMSADDVMFDKRPDGTYINSGWRPPAVNSGIANAAPRSKHITGQAIDLYDPEGEIDEWCMENPQVLETVGLWQEHPAATKGWCHLQSVPPRSGRRVFYP